jgi:hypothetical protein
MLLHSIRLRSLPALLGLALLAAAPAAHAGEDDDPEVVAQAKEHYKAGLEAYKAGKYDVAIRELKKAYLLKRLPPLLLNIGATYRKMGDLDLSLHFYQKFLDEAPADAKDRPEVEKIIGEIKKEKSSGGAEAKAASEDAPPPPPSRMKDAPSASDWKHDVIDAVPPDMPIDVRVQTAVMKGVKVFVYYRGSGQADFNSVLMKRRGREKVGRIPAQAVSGRSLQYYIEAKDSAGTVVKNSGSQANPNIIMVEDGVKPVMLASMSRRGDEEPEEQPADEEEKPRKRKPSRDLDDESAPTSGRVDLTDSEPVRTPPRKATSGMSPLMLGGIIGVSLGAAFVAGGGAMLGIAKNTADTLSADSKAPVDSNNNPIFFNNDPNAGKTQEAGLQMRGKALNVTGIVTTTLGGLGVAAGIGCFIADSVMKSERAHPHKKHKKRRRIVEDEEEEEQSSNWYVAPSFGPSQVGVGGGFTF